MRLACVAVDVERPCVVPSIDSASDKSYPIARPLFMYSPDAPKGAIKAYLDWILSDDGQCIIKRTGYAPVRALNCG